MKYWMIAISALMLSTFATRTSAQNVQPSDPLACVGIETDSQRLACYDRAMQHESSHDVAVPETPRNRTSTQSFDSKATNSLFAHDKPAYAEAGTANVGADVDTNITPPVSLLDSRWELTPKTKLGTFNVRGYKPVYLMPAFYTSNVNERPHSPAPGHSAQQAQQLDQVEAKFQISFKTKTWQGVFGDVGDLWFAYTQTSHWQVYNDGVSRPFRETNYEPEIMLVFNTHYNVLGWDGRLFGIGINHQSNGRSDPLSRSWNRVIANIGFERDGWSVMFRPWWRIDESASKDDNPDIEDYMGRGEVRITHEAGDNEYSLLLRHSLRGGDRSHGAAQLSWAFPIQGTLQGYMQLFHGYGESMIDYNHRATYIGVGVMVLGWY